MTKERLQGATVNFAAMPCWVIDRVMQNRPWNERWHLGGDRAVRICRRDVTLNLRPDILIEHTNLESITDKEDKNESN